MAGAMKFCYYNALSNNKSNTFIRTLSMIDLENHLNDFKKRFRCSGSLGIPFFPESVMHCLKHQLAIGKYMQEEEEQTSPQLTIIVKTQPSSESLTNVLNHFQSPIRVQHIESRESHTGEVETIPLENSMEILIQMELPSGGNSNEIIEKLRNAEIPITVISCTIPPKSETNFTDPGINAALTGSQWFPKTIYDLDKCTKSVLMYGTELDADHPGFKDEEYRKRRLLFADIAFNYKQGCSIPRVEYTQSELKTWRTIYRELRVLHSKYACKEYLDNFQLLERHCGYSEDSIPQLDDVNRFLKSKTGFRVRPVAGYLSSRDFLASLAFRVFNCTQYIRHPADPFYSPEPDCVHELMGHISLLADPNFAQFSQELGLASLGASEKDLSKLATLYFFSIEFGLCRENGQEYKIFGAGLLSSIGELKHAIDGKSSIMHFDPDIVVKQECLITTFQSKYFYTENFEEAQQKLRTFTNNMKRPFILRYNPYTESVEILNNKRSLTLAVNSLRSDINLLANALENIL